MDFLKYRKIYFILSGVLVLASLASLIIFQLNLGIDFTGGSILELEYAEQSPANEIIREKLAALDLGTLYIQPAGENRIILRTKEIDESAHQQILQKLEEDEGREIRFESIGPIIGRELKQKTKWMIGLALILIVLYVAWAFRKVSQPCKSWQYGIAAIIALGHDVLIPVGVFSILGELYGVAITVPIITALLTVLGYSVNDTVVVFDRVRENLLKGHGDNFRETVNKSLNQTLTRSINTSLTTLFVLFAVFFLGGATLRYFSLALIVGVIAGTYSSIFLAGPLLFSWLKWRKRI